jgi:hypothetical protein
MPRRMAYSDKLTEEQKKGVLEAFGGFLGLSSEFTDLRWSEYLRNRDNPRDHK